MKVWFFSYIDSKKRIFRERRANGVAPTVELAVISEKDTFGFMILTPSFSISDPHIR